MMQGVAFSEVNGNNLAAPSVKYMATLRLFLWRYKGKDQLRTETFLHFLLLVWISHEISALTILYPINVHRLSDRASE